MTTQANRLTIVELYGSPSAGKSRYAARIQSMASDAGVNSFWVHEFIKFHAIRGLPLTPSDQLFIAGNQFYNESSTYGNPPKYRMVVTDSPVSLAGFYAYHYSGQDREYLTLTKSLKNWMEISDSQFNIERIRLRVPLQEKHFHPEGRFEKSFGEVSFTDEIMDTWLSEELGYFIEDIPVDPVESDRFLLKLIDQMK